MSHPPIIDAVREFLATVSEGEAPSEEQLAVALDRLVALCHDAPTGAPAECEDAPPPADYSAMRARLQARFPELGLYAVASEPLVPHCTSANVADAIEDLADILIDLGEVSWRFDTFGAGDACWTLHFAFAVHWGQHARNLAAYLHARHCGRRLDRLLGRAARA